MEKSSQLWHTAAMADGMVLTGRLEDRTRWSPEGDCSVVRALGVVGTRSAFVLLREAFYGTTRFDELVRRADITPAVASARLRELVAAGLLEKRPYREEGARTRQEYVLTGKGAELWPALVALHTWGDRWLQDEDGGPPVALRHAGCGAEVRAVVRCAEGHEVTAAEVEASEGPGWRRRRRPAA